MLSPPGVQRVRQPAQPQGWRLLPWLPLLLPQLAEPLTVWLPAADGLPDELW